MERESWIRRAKASNEVGFEGLDCPFRCISSMRSWGNELVINIIVVQKFFEDLGAFIVEFVEFRSAPSVDEFVIKHFESSENCFCVAIGDGGGINQVAVVIIEDKNVVVAGAGREWETTCLVGVDVAGWGSIHDGGVDVVGALPVVQRCGESI